VSLRGAALVVGLLAALTGAAMWVVARLDGAEVRARPAVAEAAAPEPAPVTPLVGATLTPPELADPAQARRLELLVERRGAYRAMADGFKGRAAPAALARLEPALRALWPRGGPVSWTAACRGDTCRLEVAGATDGWVEALEGHRAVRAVVDRVVADPDDGRAPAYLVLAAEAAPAGSPVLEAVARELQEAGAAAACLRGAPAEAAVELELEVDATGVTFRAGGSAEPDRRECVTGALTDALASVRVEPGARRAARTLVIRAAP